MHGVHNYSPVFSQTCPDCVLLVLHSEYCDVIDVVGSSSLCYSGCFVCFVNSSNVPFPTFDINFEDKEGIGDVASLRLSLDNAILSLGSFLSHIQ